MSEDRIIQKVTVEFIDGTSRTWTGIGSTSVYLTHHQENYTPKGPHESYVSVNMLLDEELKHE